MRSTTSPRAIAEFLVSKAADRTLAIGPLVWQPSDGNASKHWYFVVGSADSTAEFHCDQITVGGESDRVGFLAELVRHRPLVVHTFDDELQLANFCESLWPCAKITRIREQLEQERA
jgi:hypothetical protein